MISALIVSALFDVDCDPGVGAAALETASMAHLFRSETDRVVWLRSAAPFSALEVINVFPELGPTNAVCEADVSPAGNAAILHDCDRVLSITDAGSVVPIAPHVFEYDVAFGPTGAHVLALGTSRLMYFSEAASWIEVASVPVTTTAPIALIEEMDGTVVGMFGNAPVTIGTSGVLVLGSALMPTARSLSATMGSAGNAVIFAETGDSTKTEVRKLIHANGTWSSEILESLGPSGSPKVFAASEDAVVVLSISYHVLRTGSPWTSTPVVGASPYLGNIRARQDAQTVRFIGGMTDATVFEEENGTFVGRDIGSLRKHCGGCHACSIADARTRRFSLGAAVIELLGLTVVLGRRIRERSS